MSILTLGRKKWEKAKKRKEGKFPIKEWEKAKKKRRKIPKSKSRKKKRKERKFPINDRKKTEEICIKVF